MRSVQPRYNRLLTLTHYDCPLVFLVIAPDEVLDGKVGSQRCPEELHYGDADVDVEERHHGCPGVRLVINPDLPSGAVEEQGEVDGAGAEQEANLLAAGVAS